MSKPYDGPWVIRSLMFAPGHIEKMVQKASGSEADSIVLDLEDAVPDASKAQGREIISSVLKSGLYNKKTVFVRINPLDSGLTLFDLEAVACQELHGFVYPMARTSEDIRNFDAQLSLMENYLNLTIGHFSIIGIIETPLAVLNAYPIATASNRMVGLIFGCEDYLADLQGRHNVDEVSLHTPRSRVAISARAAGIEPIDTPYVEVHDLTGLRSFANSGRDLGMAGMCSMAPRQISTINEIYTPTEEEIRYSTDVVNAEEEALAANRGIVVIDGKFISPPTVKAARNLLARYEAIRNLQNFGHS